MSDKCLVEDIPNKPLITFIIPTIGRHTLSKTLDSLINQTNPNWKAIVIFDGITSTIQNTDPRIRIIESPIISNIFTLNPERSAILWNLLLFSKVNSSN